MKGLRPGQWLTIGLIVLAVVAAAFLLVVFTATEPHHLSFDSRADERVLARRHGVGALAVRRPAATLGAAGRLWPAREVREITAEVTNRSSMVR